MSNTQPPPLGEGIGPRVMTIAVKGALGAIPLIGSVLAEVAGQFIPQQRIERIENYIRLLNGRLDDIEDAALLERMRDPERIDLFEEGAVLSARALTGERREYVANVVANGIRGDERSRIEAKRVLRLLNQLDDDQIVILASKLVKYSHDPDFHEKHAAIFNSPRAHLGSEREEHDKAALFELARVELVRLGLLAPTFKVSKKGELPEFDPQTGMIKQQSRKLTALGRMLLRHIGIAEDGDY